MAHNTIDYVYMPNAGNLQAPAGQTYHLPPVSLRGYISPRPSNYRKIVDHKLSMGIPDDNHWYCEWREAVKDQMLARGIRKMRTFPDHHFQQIVAGIRTLRAACDSLVRAAAANNRAVMRQIDKAVVQLVKDCWVKLTSTVKNPSTGLAPLGQNGVFYDQVMLRDWLLPPNAPDQWGPATTLPNPGQVPQSVPPAYPPQAQNVPAHQGNYLRRAEDVAVQGVAPQGVVAQGVPAQNIPDHHLNYPPQGQNVPAHHRKNIPPAQGIAVQGVAPQGIVVQGVPGQNVPDHRGNYRRLGLNVPPHPAMYPPAGQNIAGRPANYALPCQNQPGLPADNALPNPLPHAPPLNYCAQNAANAPDASAINQMLTPDPSTEISTPSLVRSNALTPRVLPRGANYAAPDPMPTG